MNGIQWSTYFTHIYVLALPERRPYMETLVADLHIPDVIWLPLVPLGKDATVRPPGALTQGDLGTILSHKKAMQDFISRSDGGRMLVFEDDVQATMPLDALAAVLPEIEHVPPNAAVYLGRCWSHCWLDTATKSPWIVGAPHSSCTHALALGRQAAQALLAQPANQPIDDMLQALVADGRVDAFAFKPGLFRQDQTRFATSSGTPRVDKYTQDCKPGYVRYQRMAIAAALAAVILGLVYRTWRAIQ